MILLFRDGRLPASRLTGSAAPTGSNLAALSYAFDGGTSLPVSFDRTTGAFDTALDLSSLAHGPHTLSLRAADRAGNVTEVTLGVMLSELIPFSVKDFSPANGAGDVGVTFRPQAMFSRAVDIATLTANSFYATDTASEKLAATIVPMAGGKGAWLFLHRAMVGASTIKLHLEGDLIRGLADGQFLDADGDGIAGGALVSSFTTVSTTAIPNTTITGFVVDPGEDLKPMTFDDIRAGADGILHTADDEFRHPLANVKVFILGREHEAVFTDAQGRFTLTYVPTGSVKVAVDGRTATNAPAGVFFPEMVMDVTVRPGVANTMMGSMGQIEEQLANDTRGEVYLPRLSTAILTDISNTKSTTVMVSADAAPALTEEQRSQLTLIVAPGSLVDDKGNPIANAQVGISQVPPELVRDMLPPGVLQHTFDITIQAPSAVAFTMPARLTMPNTFGLAAGEKTYFLSFDHTTGRLVIDGTATVSEDGQTVVTDPDTGITKPGWHGWTPAGSGGVFGPMVPPGWQSGTQQGPLPPGPYPPPPIPPSNNDRNGNGIPDDEEVVEGNEDNGPLQVNLPMSALAGDITKLIDVSDLEWLGFNLSFDSVTGLGRAQELNSIRYFVPDGVLGTSVALFTGVTNPPPDFLLPSGQPGTPRPVEVRVHISVAKGYSGKGTENEVPQNLSDELAIIRLEQRLSYLGYFGNSNPNAPQSQRVNLAVPLSVDGVRDSTSEWALGHFIATLTLEKAPNYSWGLLPSDYDFINAVNAPHWSIVEGLPVYTNINDENYATSWTEDLFNKGGGNSGKITRITPGYVITSLTQPFGGPQRYHASHQTGMDIDISRGVWFKTDVVKNPLNNNKDIEVLKAKVSSSSGAPVRAALISDGTNVRAAQVGADGTLTNNLPAGYKLVVLKGDNTVTVLNRSIATKYHNQNLEVLVSGYSQDRNEVKKLIDALLSFNRTGGIGGVVSNREREYVADIFYNDPFFFEDPFYRNWVKYEAGHFNHLHINVAPPTSPVSGNVVPFFSTTAVSQDDQVGLIGMPSNSTASGFGSDTSVYYLIEPESGVAIRGRVAAESQFSAILPINTILTESRVIQ